LERLQSCGVLAGPEQRHLASLSPVGLLMPWKIDVKVDSGRNKFTLQGTANTYGRGFSLARARVSCRMEMVERFSAYLSVSGKLVRDRATPTELLYGSLEELRRDGLTALDPNDFYLEAPYRGARLHWIRALRVRRALGGSAREEEVYVPLQFAALFSNLDEPDLCSAPGSTGLATGLVPAQARLAGLLEILERDAEAGLLYRKNRCFALAASALGDEKLRVLLEDFHKLGLNVQFMDMSGALGVPICQCFVIGAKGSLHRGHGASLSARKAILSALTETPYPYPGGGPSGPRLRRLPEVEFDALPDFSRGGPEEDLALLEALLCANGRDPVYVDLTHAGLAFPVVRALLPGAWLCADFDSFSRVSPRLYKDYVVG
ncbi:YcaO-like family protein, partial [Desulfovibrio sp. OttesenSCG-928-C14]|nr:YcaO-like family protein [Desulfovibrio sp. OttesenSCG-928-C14]